MTNDPFLKPFGDSRNEIDPGATTHLSDYWEVVSRRIWLVLTLLVLTTVVAIWFVSRQRTFYQAEAALQVSDPLQRTRSLTPGTRLSGLDIFVDPIQSEIEVLRADTIAEAVVDSLGLRLRVDHAELPRSAILTEAFVSRDVPNGERFELVYDDAGTRAELRRPGGPILGAVAVGAVLDAGFLRFVPRPPPDVERVYGLVVVPMATAAAEVSGGIAAVPRESTNIIDVSYTSLDPELAPAILNEAAETLRDYGARRVRAVASTEVAFIEERLDSARVQLSASLEEIRRFKQSEAFTNLSIEEQGLVNQSQALVDRIEDLERQRSTLNSLARKIEGDGLEDGDLATLVAIIPSGSNPQMLDQVNRIQARQADLRRVVTAEGKTADHPEARALQSQIRELERELGSTILANGRILEARLETLNRQLTELRSRQRQFPALENQLQTLELGQTTDLETYRFLLAQLYQAQITAAAATAYVDIIDRADDARMIRPTGGLNVFLGALLGLVLGISAAFFLEYLDRTVRTSSDVETLLGIPVVGVIPKLKRVDEPGNGERRRVKGLPMIVALDPTDPAAEAYRNLRMNLLFSSTEDRPLRTVTFSSPGPDEGKSTTAVNFAVMLAQSGQRVLLVDADLRRPSLHRALDVLREPGLTNLLVGDAEGRECVRPNVLPNLDFLPSGPFPPNPSELLNSRGMKRLLQEFAAKYSHVIIDSPPVLAVTDAALLSAHTDGIVLVLRSGETEQRAAERSVDQLRRIGVRVFGAVLNEVSAATSEESYYLQYYYSYQPDAPTGWERLRKGLSRARFW